MLFGAFGLLVLIRYTGSDLRSFYLGLRHTGPSILLKDIDYVVWVLQYRLNILILCGFLPSRPPACPRKRRSEDWLGAVNVTSTNTMTVPLIVSSPAYWIDAHIYCNTCVVCIHQPYWMLTRFNPSCLSVNLTVFDGVENNWNSLPTEKQSRMHLLSFHAVAI